MNKRKGEKKRIGEMGEIKGGNLSPEYNPLTLGLGNQYFNGLAVVSYAFFLY